MKLWGKLFNKKVSTMNISDSSNPWFFCTLCAKFLDYSEMIDGNKCCYCENEYFLVPWTDYKKYYNNKKSNLPI